ncbi:MAG TPA: hypothetical protein VKC34_18345, partial [Blastocatellia bacterium]|nr:hypothetical protein [Blastocatellia bacterium]
KPVVSTSIRDVVRPYGEKNLVRIADTVEEFVEAVGAALGQRDNCQAWLLEVDSFLAQTSWDQTWMGMMEKIESAISARQQQALTEPVSMGTVKQLAHGLTNSPATGD